MSFSLRFVERSIRFQEGFSLSEPFPVHIARLEVCLDFSLTYVANAFGVDDVGCYEKYSSNPDFKKWETAPYHPVRGFCENTGDSYCFRSGSSLGLLIDKQQSALVIVPWWFVRLEEGFIHMHNPFVWCDEVDEDDILSVTISVGELPSWKQKGALTRYAKYLFGESCDAIPFFKGKNK